MSVYSNGISVQHKGTNDFGQRKRRCFSRSHPADPILAMPAAYVARRQTFPLPTSRSGGAQSVFRSLSAAQKRSVKRFQTRRRPQPRGLYPLPSLPPAAARLNPFLGRARSRRPRPLPERPALLRSRPRRVPARLVWQPSRRRPLPLPFPRTNMAAAGTRGRIVCCTSLPADRS